MTPRETSRELRGALLAIGWVLIIWGLLVPRSCGDEVLPAGKLCPSGHQYEPLRLAVDGEPKWFGLCYKGKDGKAAVTRACASRPCLMEGLRSLDEQVNEANHIAPCASDDVRCILWDIYIWHEVFEEGNR